MNYTLEEIYALVGKDDKVATVNFKYESQSYVQFGREITLVFNYTQKERQNLDELLKKEHFDLNGFTKATYLGRSLSKEKVEKLKEEGINSEDIASIFYFKDSKANTFHSKETREIKTLVIPMESQSKGRDFDWMYGFTKRLVKDKIGITPHERNFYLGGKLYYEPENLTERELTEIYKENKILNEDVEYQFLFIKLMRQEISDEQKQKLGILFNKKRKKAFDVLDKHLQDVGSSMKKIFEVNVDKAVELFAKVDNFTDKKLSHTRSKIIYIDLHGYLHIYMRHVQEMKVNKHFEHKDNFQWDEQDVFTVIENVLEQSMDEIQEFFNQNPNGRYSRYGEKSLYFEGDYYTFHIECDGRLSTFHKNKK